MKIKTKTKVYLMRITTTVFYTLIKRIRGVTRNSQVTAEAS
jgi:hypothetical protein